MSATEIKVVEKIRNINDRAQKANTRIIQLNTQREQVSKELEAAVKEAVSKFGTSDITELREIYRKKAEAQGAEVAMFEQSVSDAEKIIAEIDNSLAHLESQSNA